MQSSVSSTAPDSFKNVKALVFDVFGTCVDWRTSVTKELEQKIGRDAADLAQKWRQGYIESMSRLAETLDPEKDKSYPELDDIFRGILDTLLDKDELDEQARSELSQCWHRLGPWPDTNQGLEMLNQLGLITATLSNGSVRLLIDLKKHAQMQFDAIFSSELFKSYKPSPHIYKGAVKLLNLEPQEVCMVAAHAKDLHAAKRCGLMTAFVYRAQEGHAPDEIQPGGSEFIDVVAKDFIHLAHLIAKVQHISHG